jgi:carbamate kinase
LPRGPAAADAGTVAETRERDAPAVVEPAPAPAEPIGPIYDAVEAARIEREKGWAFGADALLIVTDVGGVHADWGTPEQRAIRNATPAMLSATEFAAGSMGPRVRAACWFAERTGRFAAIGSIDDRQAMLRGEAGTRVELHPAGASAVTTT